MNIQTADFFEKVSFTKYSGVTKQNARRITLSNRSFSQTDSTCKLCIDVYFGSEAKMLTRPK